MYSVILMTALATASTAPNWGFRGHGAYHSACACYAGPSGAACVVAVPNGHFGAWSHGGFGHGYTGCTGCYGCYGGASCYGIPVPMLPVTVPPRDRDPAVVPVTPRPDTKVAPNEEEVPAPKEKKKVENQQEPGAGQQARAIIRIDVPDGGRLFVNGQAVNRGSGTRVLQTPLLPHGEVFYYEIRIEIDRAGQTQRENRLIVLQPGQDLAVRFPRFEPSGVRTASDE